MDDDRILREAPRDPTGSAEDARDRVERAMAQAERHGKRLAILQVHIAGEDGGEPSDPLLRQVTLRLMGGLRVTDEVLAGGSDRLLVLLPGVESVGAAAIVARKVLALLAQPFASDGRDARLEGCIGMALYPDHGFAPDALLRNAEEAMRRAGQRGDAEVRWYAPPTVVVDEEGEPRLDRGIA